MVVFEPGDIIFEEKPFVSVLNKSEKQLRCDFCFKSGRNQRCAGCKQVFYCSKTCQIADWRAVHKYTECHIYQLSEKVDMSIVKEDASSDQPIKYEGRISDYDTARLLLRLYLTVHYRPHRLTKAHVTPFQKTRCLDDLMEHQDEVRNHKQRMEIFDQLCRMFERCGVKTDTGKEDLLFRMFCKMYVNGFSIMSPMLAEVGRAVYVLSSLFDHSCVPNAITIFQGPNIQVRAIRRVDSTKEPVLLSYLNVMVNPTKRVQTLQNHYYFLCGCERCLYEKSALEKVKALTVENQSDQPKVFKSRVEVIKNAEKKLVQEKSLKSLKKGKKKKECKEKELNTVETENKSENKPELAELNHKNDEKQLMQKKKSESEVTTKLPLSKEPSEKLEQKNVESSKDLKQANQKEKLIDSFDPNESKEENVDEDWHELKKHKNRRLKKQQQKQTEEVKKLSTKDEEEVEHHVWDPTPSPERLKAFAARFDHLSSEDWHLLMNHEQLNKDFTAQVLRSDWPNAIKLAEKQLRCYQLYYAGDFNPEITLHLVQMLQIQRNILRAEFTMRNEIVRQLFRQLQQAILITHGKSHDLYKHEYVDLCQYLKQEC